MHTHPYEHMCKFYPYKHLQILGRQILKIDEVTTDVSLSTGMSSTTESTMPLIPENSAPTISRLPVWLLACV
jgi:hypothetical protein